MAEKHTCGPCALCKQESKRYTHAEKMNSGVFKLITEKENIKKDACICHACYKHVARNIKNCNYQPQWKQKPPICRVSCGVLTCHKEVYRHTSIASPSLIKAYLVKNFAHSQSHTTNTPLCQFHYNQVYSSLHGPVNCDSCKSKPKKGSQHYRHCPAPELINTYLGFISNEQSTLTESSRICYSCYIFFNCILNNFQLATNSPEDRTLDVDSVLKILSKKINSILAKISKYD